VEYSELHFREHSPLASPNSIPSGVLECHMRKLAATRIINSTLIVEKSIRSNVELHTTQYKPYERDLEFSKTFTEIE